MKKNYIGVCVLLGWVAVLRGQTCPPGIQVLSPQPGEILSSHRLVEIVVKVINPKPTFLGPESISTGQITAISSTGAQVRIPYGFRDAGASGILRGVWDLRKVISGDWTIYTGAGTPPPPGCPSSPAAIPVVVNRAPQLDNFVIEACPVGPAPKTITLRAEMEDTRLSFGAGKEHDRMVSFTWNPGDGSPNETFFSGINTFTHAYAAGTQQAVVWVTGDDERGGRFFEARELDVTNCKFPRRDAQRRECGCDSMVVSATAGRTSQIYCMVDAPDDKPGCSLAVNAPVGACTGYLEKPYECSLGPKDARIPIPSTQGGEYRFLGWSFDVNASFSRSTLTPAECSQGQFLRQTVEGQLAGSPPTITRAIPASPVPAFGEYPMPLSNGASVTVVTSYPIPVFNAPNQGRKVSYGANGHVLEDRFTRPMDWAQGPSGTGFRQWFDQAAAYLPLNQAQIQNSSFAFLRHQAEFITFVAGSHGTCWCQFRIEQELTPSGRQAIGGGPPPMALKLIGGRNCTLQ